MRCPHCTKESKAKVLESRRTNGEVWRNRLCGQCLKPFVSRETTSVEMKFPWSDLQKKRRLAASEEKPAQKANKWVFPRKFW